VEGDLEGEGGGGGERVVKRGEEIKGQEVKGVMEQRDALVFRTNYLFLEVSVGYRGGDDGDGVCGVLEDEEEGHAESCGDGEGDEGWGGFSGVGVE